MTVIPEASAVRELLLSAVRAGSFPGCVAGWFSLDQPTVDAVATGVTSIGTESRKATTDTWYDLASLTKPLVVTTLFLLARRGGNIDLDSTVGEFFQDVGAFDAVNIENLLTHTSGLPGWAPLYTSGFSPDDIVSAIGSLHPIGPPGTVCQYSCPGFILLGKILEKCFGMDLAQAFETQVSAPLGLNHHLSFKPPIDSAALAGGAANPDAEAELLRELSLDPTAIPQWQIGQPDDGNARFLNGVAGNAGLFGTIRGILQLAREYLPDGGTLLTSMESAIATECRTAHLNQFRGLGWQIACSPGSSAGSGISPDSVGHVGFTGTSLWIDRLNRRIIALLSNRHHPGHRPTDLHPLRRRFNRLVSDIFLTNPPD